MNKLLRQSKSMASKLRLRNTLNRQTSPVCSQFRFFLRSFSQAEKSLPNVEDPKGAVEPKKVNPLVKNDENPDLIEIHNGEVKDSKQIFEMAWNNLSDKIGDHNMNFPKDIFFLAGAPGAGKGDNTEYIKKIRGISTETIETSSLLQSDEAKAVKAAGGLVASRLVVQLLLQKLLENQYATGVVVDGFPRTGVQAECIKHLHDRMISYKEKYKDTKFSSKFTRPMFAMAVLFVEEETSLERQLARGGKILEHNRRVALTKYGDPLPMRETDTNEDLARERYRQFKDHIIPSLEILKKYFNFHFILADAKPEVVKSRILKELQYQSSTELQEETFELLRKLPLASLVLKDARVKLVRRLDGYAQNNLVLFKNVLELINRDFISIIKYNALSGHVIIRSENEIFKKRNALRMAIDILTERGFGVYLDVQRVQSPDHVVEGEIINVVRYIYQFTVRFEKPNIRNKDRFLF